MSKKKTHEEFIKELKDINNNITILSKYINNHEKILCECNTCKYTWNTTPKSLLNGHSCPKCAGVIKKTNEEFVNEMYSINPNIEIITPYLGRNKKVSCRCSVDKYVWSATANSLLSGKGCPKCSGNIKRTHDEFINEIKNKNNNIKIIGKYINNSTPILCKCKIHNIEWNAIPYNLLNGSGCPKCGLESSALKRATTHDDFLKKLSISSPNIKVLGKYKNCKTHIKVQCKKCNYIWESNPDYLLKNINSCPLCNGKLQWSEERYREEFYKNNTNCTIVDIDIKNNFVNMDGKIKVKCKKDDYIWDVTSAYALKHNIQCPLCRNFKTVTGINDLATLHPELVKYFKYKERSKIVNSGGRNKEEMICPYCGNEKRITPRQLVTHGFGCQECSDGISYPNKFCRAFIKQLPVENLIFEYNPSWIKPRKFDNYFEYGNKKYILEADGGFHFITNTYTNETCDMAQQKDMVKENIAKEHDITVIRIDCKKSNKEYISCNIKNSILSKLFDLSNIDWDLCDRQATTSLVYSVCKDYNEKNCSLDEQFNFIDNLSKEYGVHYATIQRYLKRGTELGLCNYNSKKYIKRTSKKVTLFDDNNNFISNFLSPTDCLNYINEKYPNEYYNISGICSACKKPSHKYKNFIIRYTDEIN